jgi:hypothetical protein
MPKILRGRPLGREGAKGDQMTSRIRRMSARSMAVTAVAFAALIGLATSAQASLTAPANGATVRGTAVTITENTGGQDNCIFGNSGDDTRILIDGVVRFTKGDGGSYTVGWNTLNPPTPNGSHTITSQGRNISNGFLSCSTGSYYNISTISVTVANRSFLSLSAPVSQYSGESFVVTAGVTLEAGAIASLGGRMVTFCITGGACSNATTDGGGIASTSLVANGNAGARTITATYGGDTYFLASTASSGFQVLARPTSLTNLSDAEAYHGEDATLSARLLDVRSGAPMSGAPVTLNLMQGSTVVQSLPATTNGLGIASTTMTASDDAGAYAVVATYAGSGTHAASTASKAFQILPRPTSFTYTGAVDGFWGEDATLTGVLTDVRAGTPLSGYTIDFSLGTATGNATTDASGTASVDLALGQDPGAYTAGGAFAGTVNFVGSSDNAAFEILRRPTTLTYDGATSGPRGSTVTLSATLTDDRLGGTGVSGKTVAFTLGSASGTATTDTNGTATLDVLLDQDPDATYTVEASFAEDAHYLGSADSAGFDLGWEHTFTSTIDEGSVSLNTSTREFRVTTSSGTTSIKHDADMKIVSLPDGLVLPCDPGSPETCVPPVPPAPCEVPDGCVPPAPCDINTPEGCIPPVPPAPCEVPDGCVPPVPSCVDDPAGGDPICPEDYLPLAAIGAPTNEATGVCVINPIDESPLCAEDPTPDDLDHACTTGATTGCSQRAVLIAFSDEEISIAGVFDLETGVFTAAIHTSGGTALLGSSQQTPPPAPCDINTPDGCVPPVPPAPCELPEGCLPPVPPVPDVPACVDDPLGGQPICRP